MTTSDLEVREFTVSLRYRPNTDLGLCRLNGKTFSVNESDGYPAHEILVTDSGEIVLSYKKLLKPKKNTRTARESDSNLEDAIRNLKTYGRAWELLPNTCAWWYPKKRVTHMTPTSRVISLPYDSIGRSKNIDIVNLPKPDPRYKVSGTASRG